MEVKHSASTSETPANDLEVMKKMEDEHFRLQRQVRAIQTDRLHRSMGVHPIFRRQDELLKVLKMEYLDLGKNLKIANTGAHKKINKRMKMELRRALLLRMESEQEYEGRMTTLKQLDGLIHKDMKNQLNLKKLVNTNVGQIKERMADSEKRLLSTENRFESAMKRFNVVQHENKVIREEIECMLQDRAQFNHSWNKMMKALGKGKKFLTDLFESSTLAYDQRDEWCSKLRSVQHKGKVDQMLQIQEMRDLQKAFDHEMKLYHFLSKKGVMRLNQKQQERDEMLKQMEEERLQNDLINHQRILDEIMEYTEEEKIEKIMEKFEAREQENFSIYSLLVEFCAENVILEKQLFKLRQVVADRNDWNIMQQEKRDKRLEGLREKIEEQKKRNERLRNTVAEKDRTINKTIQSINEMFSMLNCSTEPFVNLLGDKMPSVWLLDLPLRLITEKIKEFLETVYYYERFLSKKEKRSLISSRLKKYTINPILPECWTALPNNLIVTADPCPACVEARWMSRVTDKPETPFSKREALRAIKMLSNDPAFLRSDRIHPLTDCRVPRSRTLLAARNLGQTAFTI